MKTKHKDKKSPRYEVEGVNLVAVEGRFVPKERRRQPTGIILDTLDHLSAGNLRPMAFAEDLVQGVKLHPRTESSAT